MSRLVESPREVAAELVSGAVWGLSNAVGRQISGWLAGGLSVTFAPPVDAQDEAFPPERVRVVALRDEQVFVYPLGPQRTWRHRNESHPRSLCLQHPNDDPALLWRWEDGLERLLTRTHIHLLCEEVWRRTGEWPGVELPHGEPPDGVLEPIRDPLLRKGVRRWAR
jgi:hypothetical protein